MQELKITVAKQVIRWLGEHGIRHIFGTPSGAWLPYMQAMHKDDDVEFVLVSNEATAGFMACVYAWLKKVPGACYATIGPGATNLSTGVGAALLNRAPVLCFTTEAPRAMIGRTVQMAIDQQKLYEPLTKLTMRLDPDRVYEQMDEAFAHAVSGVPGPVHIGLPEDLAGIEIETHSRPASIKDPLTVDAIPASMLDEMESCLSKARLPVLAIGLGAVRAGCSDTIRIIAEKHQIPVVLTPMAKGMLREDHPAYAGVLFHALSDQVAQTYKQADLIIGVGYDPVEFNYEAWMPNVPLLHIDVKPADIDRSEYPELVNVVGEIPGALERLANMNASGSDWDFDALAVRRKTMFSAFVPQPGRFGPLAVLQSLREKLPEDGIMACDVGAHTHLIGQMWPTPAPYTLLMDNGWSSMGFGVPAAIAAKLCEPNREVVCVTGDGGFLMMAGEMATARRLGLRIIFVVLCDYSLDLIRIKQERKGFDSYGMDLREKTALDEGTLFGVPIINAHDEETYQRALSTAFEEDGPVIIQVLVDSSEYNDLILRPHK